MPLSKILLDAGEIENISDNIACSFIGAVAESGLEPGLIIKRAIARNQLKKVVDELKERAEIEHEGCDEGCAHRGVSIWFDIYDWQSLLDEVKEA